MGVGQPRGRELGGGPTDLQEGDRALGSLGFRERLCLLTGGYWIAVDPFLRQNTFKSTHFPDLRHTHTY